MAHDPGQLANEEWSVGKYDWSLHATRFGLKTKPPDDMMVYSREDTEMSVFDAQGRKVLKAVSRELAELIAAFPAYVRQMSTAQTGIGLVAVNWQEEFAQFMATLAEELGCKPDNEDILQAIHDLKQKVQPEIAVRLDKIATLLGCEESEEMILVSIETLQAIIRELSGRCSAIEAKQQAVVQTLEKNLSKGHKAADAVWIVSQLK